jgi:hypothetical protein
LAKDPDFIKVMFYIGRFITIVVDTEAERANIEALRNDLDSASTRIDVSNLSHHSPYHISLKSNSSPLPKYYQALSVQGPDSEDLFEMTHRNANPWGWTERGEWAE